MASFLQETLEGKIDFEGQKLTDTLVRNGLIGSTGAAFVLGFVSQSLRVTFGVVGLGVVLLMLAVVPPWPMYTKNPVKWLPVSKSGKAQ